MGQSLLNSAPGSVHARVIALAGENRSVLELGCSTGYMSAALSQRGCRVTGVEIDPIAAREAAAHCWHVLELDLDQSDLTAEFPPNSFDVVVAADVLEHLRDPVRVLSSLPSVLRPDGMVVASVPNVAHGSVRLALLGGRFSYTDRGLLDRGHLKFYTRDSLEELFLRAGLVITSLERVEAAIDATEVDYDPQLASDELMKTLQEDREARTYQFVVVARPAQSLPAGVRERIGELLRQRESMRSDLESADRRLRDRETELAHLTRHTGELEKTVTVLRSELDSHQHQAEVLLAEHAQLRGALAQFESAKGPAGHSHPQEQDLLWRDESESSSSWQAAVVRQLEEMAPALRAQEGKSADTEALLALLREAESQAETALESEASLRKLLLEAHDELIQRDDQIIALTRELGARIALGEEIENLRMIISERDRGISFLRSELGAALARAEAEKTELETQIGAAKAWAASESEAIRERDLIIESLEARLRPSGGIMERLLRRISGAFSRQSRE